jgi:hypothetical protein
LSEREGDVAIKAPYIFVRILRRGMKMAGRSLWSVLMLTWLSATNAVTLPRETDAPNISISEPRDDDDEVMTIDPAHEDESAPKPRVESTKTGS